MGNGLLILDHLGRILTVNREFERLFEYPTAELVGRPADDIISGLTESLSALGRERQGEQAERGLKLPGRKSNGDNMSLWINPFLVPAPDGSPSPREVVLLVQAGKDGENAEERAAHCPCFHAHHWDRLQSLDVFAAGIVHEIRNPLAAISTNAQYVMEKLSPSQPFFEEMEDILADVKRLEEVATAVLNLAHPSKSEVGEAAIEDLLRELLRYSRKSLQLKGVELKTEFDRSCSKVLVDLLQIKQVFFNIIRNAAEAMPEGGKLWVRTSHAASHTKGKPHYVVVDVVDNGKGIAREHLARIFDPFYSIDSRGTGLGLALSRKIIDDHSGKINVESEVGKGTKFSVILPLRS